MIDPKDLRARGNSDGVNGVRQSDLRRVVIVGLDWRGRLVGWNHVYLFAEGLDGDVRTLKPAECRFACKAETNAYLRDEKALVKPPGRPTMKSAKAKKGGSWLEMARAGGLKRTLADDLPGNY